MTENEYSIKPLSNLPNIARLNPSQDGKNKNKGKYSSKQKKTSEASEMNEPDNEESSIENLSNLDDDEIDFCA